MGDPCLDSKVGDDWGLCEGQVEASGRVGGVREGAAVAAGRVAAGGGGGGCGERKRRGKRRDVVLFLLFELMQLIYHEMK